MAKTDDPSAAKKASATDTAGAAARRVAIEAMLRIEKGGAYANLVLPPILDRSELAGADRRFVTELVYGTTRMKRACDHLVDRFLLDRVEPRIRAALRLGAYQLAFLKTPAHAAVDATVGAVDGRGRSVVNAVLRRVADAPVTFDNRAIELSYPDWILDRLSADLGPERADAALQAMNEPASVTTRDDGYIQDVASQLVVAAVDAQPSELIVDLCAAPGGKATGMAATGATVIATELRPKRAGLVAANAERLDARLPVVVADGAAPPLRPGTADKVLVDAPCSGLGSLRRRADARWRIDADAPERLAKLQVELVRSGLQLLAPGGVLTFAVCTLTAIESHGVLASVKNDPGVDVVTAVDDRWDLSDGVATLYPDSTDAMMLFQVSTGGPTDL